MRPRRLTLAIAAVFGACLAIDARAQLVTELTAPVADSEPSGITLGPDGNMWFTGYHAEEIVRINPDGSFTQFPTGAGTFPGVLVTGPDNNLWFSDAGTLKIGRMTPAGVVDEFPLLTAGGPAGLTAGPDGNLWFVEGNANKIGRITTSGVVTEFSVPTAGVPLQIAAGPDGNLWFTEFTAGKIGRITTLGAITEFTVPTAGSEPQGITGGPDGNVWFTETNTNKVGRITPAGVITEFAIRTPTVNNIGIAAGPDGALWFTASVSNRIGRMTTDGKASDVLIATPNAGISLIAAGPDGTVWFSEAFTNKVGRITLGLQAQPMQVDAHAVIGTTSNVNGVLEPGETVELSPAWRNDLAGAEAIAGAASALTGPAGPTYTIVDGAADYGSVNPGATADCHDATGDCYRITISGARPVPHWDAQVTETLGNRGYFTRTIHVGNSFSDVPTSNPFYAYIEGLFHGGATGGCGGGLYCPNGTVTRAQMAVFLLKGKYGSLHVPPAATGAVFGDVHIGDFAADWIEELAALGITGGCGGGDYCPGNPVTRAQMAVFLLKSEHGSGYMPPDCIGVFGDVACPSTFAPWIEQLAAEGITAGCGGGNYCPNDPNIRGQMAVFLSKTYGMVLYGP
jgi:streptogramin lyase